MSSSLLLGNYSIQEQRENAHIASEITSSSPYHCYKEHEYTFLEETSKYLSSISPTSHNKLKKCTCCPYGFHIDLDFIRYCEQLAANAKRPTTKQLDRRNKRRQRKSLEVMLGFDDQWVLDLERNLQPPKHKIQTVYEAYDDTQQSSTSPYDNIECSKELHEPDFGECTDLNQTFKKHPADQGDFVNDILSDVYHDFERTLERTSTRSQKPSKESSCISNDGTYCADNQLDVDAYVKKTDLPSTSFSQSITTENIVIEEIHSASKHQQKPQQQQYIEKWDDQKVQISRNDEVSSHFAKENGMFSIEIERLSLANRNLSDQLQSVRNQLSDNLVRVRDFEERVKLIPKLQLELSVEKAENRDMHLKLKALENVLKKKEQQFERKVVEIDDESTKFKQFNTQRVCATSLESLNIRFPSSPSPTAAPQQSHKGVSCQLKTQPSTQNVACMTTKSVLRDVGVVTMPVQIPTRTWATNTDFCDDKNPVQELPKKPIMKSVCVQSDCEPKIQTKTIATITDFPKIQTKSTGMMAMPNVNSISCMAIPDHKSIGTDNIHQKIKTRSFGTDPIKHLMEILPVTTTSVAVAISPKPLDAPISLKLLDNIQAIPIVLPEPAVKPKVAEKPKEFRSMGIQHSPKVSDKFIQCKENVVEPPPPVQTRVEATDTSDLTLHIHRGVNTDTPAPLKHRHTNTDRIDTNEKATSTITEKINTKNSGTSTEAPLETPQTNFNEHQCHNCLAKIEIKQRTIIKNPNKSQNAANIANLSSTTTTTTTTTTSSNTTTDETYHEESTHSLQQSDSQSRIPRPTALISPRPERKFNRQNTYTIQTTPLSSPSTTSSVAQCPAEAYLFSTCASTTTASANTSEIVAKTSVSETSTYQNQRDIEHTRERTTASVNASTSSSTSKNANDTTAIGASVKQPSYNDDDEPPKLWSHSMKSSSTYSSLATKPRQKVNPSKEMQAALKVINDSLLKGQHLATTLKNANKIVQKEWFRVSSTENAHPFEVEDYLDYFEEYSPDLLKYMVNLTDANGNSAIHYAVSHGNFDIVSILLDSKVCNIDNTNNAGYTCVMLVSLAKLDVAEHQTVVQRLFQMADVNVRAKKHSQTALMLATSHGNFNMVRMLLDAGADINIQDEDGSTALMCAAEHGRMDIIKILLAQPDCDSTIQDMDGSTALKISLEAGYRDIGVLLYAHEYMIKNKSPYTSLRNVGRNQKAPYSSSRQVSNTNISESMNTSSEVVSGTGNSKLE